MLTIIKIVCTFCKFVTVWALGNCNVVSQDLLHLGGDDANGDDMILRAATPCTRRGRNKYSCKYREANMLLAACWNHQSQALASSICAFPLVLLSCPNSSRASPACLLCQSSSRVLVLMRETQDTASPNILQIQPFRQKYKKYPSGSSSPPVFLINN